MTCPFTYTGANPISKQEVHKDQLYWFYLRLRRAARCKCGRDRSLTYDADTRRWTATCLGFPATGCGTARSLIEPKEKKSR